MKRHFTLLLMCGFTLAWMLTACSSPVRVPPPEVVDTWQLPQDVEVAPPVSCEEIRQQFTYDAQAPLDIQEEKRYRDAGLTVIEFNYASPMGGRVPAILVVPDGKGPFAGMLFMHGSSGDRWQLLGIAKSYARLGAVGITIGAPFSRPEHDNFYPWVFLEKDRREQIQLILDLRRAVDVLLTRPEVDPQRLAYLGTSYGGAMGGLLAGAEDRLKAYALEVGDGGLVEHFVPNPVMGLPEEKRRNWLAWMWPIEPIHYVGCAAPAALLFQNGTLDTQVSPANALRYQEAGSQPKTILWYEGGHGLPQQAYQDQAEWLREKIGIAHYRMAFPRSVGVVLVVWLLLTAGSLVFLILDFFRTRQVSGGAAFMWVLTTVFLGPLGLLAYWLTDRSAHKAEESAPSISPVRHALAVSACAASVWTSAGTLSGLVVEFGLILSFPQVFYDNPVLQIATLILIPMGLNGLSIAIFKWFSRPEMRHRRLVLVEMVSSFLVLVGAVPTLVALIAGYFGPWTYRFPNDLSYPPLWGGFSLAALAGMLVAYPFHWWMIRRKVARKIKEERK